MRAGRVVGWTLGSIVVLVLIGFFVLILTESGLRWSFYVLDTVLPGELSATSLDGRLVGPLQVEGLAYSDEALDVRAEQLSLDWRPVALLRGVLHFQTVKLNDVDVVTHERKEEPAREPLRLLPLELRVDQAELEGLRVITGAQQATEVTRLTARAHIDDGLLQVETLNLESPQANLSLQGSLGLRPDREGTLHSRWRVNPEPTRTVQGQGSVSGNLEQLRVEQSVQAPFAAHLEGIVYARREPLEWQAQLRLEPTELNTIMAGARPATVSADLQATGIGDLWNIQGSGVIRDPDAGPLRLALLVERQDSRWTIERLAADSPDRPLQFEARGELDTGVRQTLQMNLQWRDLVWPLQDPATFASERGALGIEGTLADYRFALEAAVSGTELPGATVRANGSGNREALRVEHLQAALLGGQVDGEGRLQWQPQLRMEAALQAQQLDPSVVWPEWPGQLKASFALDAARGDAGWQGQLALESLGGSLRGRPVEGQALALLEGDSLRVPELRLTSSGSRLTGEGAVAWAPKLDAQASVRLQDFDPALFMPEWPGHLQGQIELSAERREGQLHARAQLAELTGELRGYPVEGSGRVAVDGDRISVPALQLASGSARLQASAQLEETWSAQWRLEVPQLDHVLPDSAGSLASQGTVSGPPDALSVDAGLEASGVRWQEIGIEDLDAQVRADLEKSGQISIDITGQQLDLGENQFEEVRLQAAGTTRAHDITISARQSERKRIVLQAEGGLQEAVWRGRLHDALLSWARLGEWRQQTDSRLTVSAERMQLESLCLQDKEATLCAGGEWNPGQTGNIELELTGLPASRLQPLIPNPAVEASGTIGAEGNLVFREQRILDLQLTIAARDGELVYPVRRDERETTAYRELGLQVDGDETGVRAQVRLDLAEAGQVSGAVRLPGWNTLAVPPSSQPVSGQVEVVLDELGLIPVVAPDLVIPGGQMRADLTLGGTVAAPGVSGEAVVTAPSVGVPRLNVTLKDVQLRARTAEGARMQLDLSATSGPGTLNIAGWMQPEGKQWRAELQVTGDQVEVSRLPQAHVFASPDLNLQISPGRLHFTGKVAIPSADIRIPEPTGVQGRSTDVVIVGAEEAEAEDPGWSMTGQVAVVLGNRVKVSGLGFAGRIAGSIQVNEGEGLLTTAQGELTVPEGEFKAYGTDLNITKGRLLFAGGPVSNPAVDVTAVKTVEDVLVGVRVTGTVQSLRVDLFSTPPMDEGDILSYLVLGRPLDEAGSADGQALYAAASALGFTGGDMLVQRIARNFGLSEVGIESAPGTSDASLVLGTYLSPELYFRYIRDLVGDGSIFQIRYRLSPRWVLRTESGTTGSGVDLIYTLDR